MKVIISIDGRDAIPVRAIPLLTDWHVLSPDVCAEIFSGRADTTVQHMEGLRSYRLVNGAVQQVPGREWQNWTERQLDACSERIRNDEANHEIGYQQWRRESLLILPAGVFAWRDEFEAAFQAEYGQGSMRERFNPETFNLTDYELNYDPQHGPRDDWREVVMEGFISAPTDAALAPDTVKGGTQPALTDEQKDEIVRLYQCGHGKSVRSLAMQFNVSRRTVDAALAAAGAKVITPRKGAQGVRRGRTATSKTARKPA
ncbi:MAG: hypothetical protein KUL80_08970 [Comamonas sp.]|nr:hypothetical protein [Comamonas sp.]